MLEKVMKLKKRERELLVVPSAPLRLRFPCFSLDVAALWFPWAGFGVTYAFLGNK